MRGACPPASGLARAAGRLVWRPPAAAAALPPVSGGRHRAGRSRGDAAARPPGPGAAGDAFGVPGPAGTGAPAGRSSRHDRPGWDADQALTELYGSHGRALTQLAALLVNDVAAADEIVQAAFAAMHGAWRRLQDGDRALSYLRRAVVSRARAHRAARADLPAGQLDPPPAGQAAITAPDPLLLAALRALPARQREALVLRYFAGLPGTQIASAMGISTRAVAIHTGRGMAFLQAAQRNAAPSLPGRQLGTRGASGRPGT